MGKLTQSKYVSPFEWGLSRHVTVCYRHTPRNSGRAFIANSSKSVDALVFALSRDCIGLLLSQYIEPGTPVRIEMGNNGKVAYVDAVANITHTTQVADDRWRSLGEWERKLTPEELLVSGHRAFQGPHGVQ
jgi:hypothetical protein